MSAGGPVSRNDWRKASVVDKTARAWRLDNRGAARRLFDRAARRS